MLKKFENQSFLLKQLNNIIAKLWSEKSIVSLCCGNFRTGKHQGD